MTPAELSDFGKYMSQGGVEGLPSLGDAFIEVMTDSSWAEKPAGGHAGKGSKQDAISAIRRLRKGAIKAYMLSQPELYPTFAQRNAEWAGRTEGEMKEPASSKQSGPLIKSPF